MDWEASNLEFQEEYVLKAVEQRKEFYDLKDSEGQSIKVQASQIDQNKDCMSSQSEPWGLTPPMSHLYS